VAGIAGTLIHGSGLVFLFDQVAGDTFRVRAAGFEALYFNAMPAERSAGQLHPGYDFRIGVSVVLEVAHG
jgi:hypothetical protein